MEFVNDARSVYESKTDAKYLSLLEEIMSDGEEVVTRNSKVKRSVAMRADFRTTPLIRLRKTAWKNALKEWEFFMSGSDRLDDLHPSVRHWWEPFAVDGLLPHNYASQFRYAAGMDKTGEGIVADQIAALVDGLRNHPNSRRHILTTWNAAEMLSGECNPTNCHNTVTQAFVVGGDRLRLVTYQRSSDMVCGLPHNWIQMAAFQLWLCAQAKLKVDGLTWIGGDCHIYEQHYELVRKMLETPAPDDAGPVLCYEPTSDEFKADDFYLSEEYKPVLTDRAEMVV